MMIKKITLILIVIGVIVAGTHYKASEVSDEVSLIEVEDNKREEETLRETKTEVERVVQSHDYSIEREFPNATDELNFVHDVLGEHFELLNNKDFDEIIRINNWDIPSEEVQEMFTDYVSPAWYQIRGLYKYNDKLICKIIVSNLNHGEESYSSDELFNFKETIIVNMATGELSYNKLLSTEIMSLEEVEIENLFIQPFKYERYSDGVRFYVKVRNGKETTINSSDILMASARVNDHTAFFDFDEVHTPLYVEPNQTIVLQYNLALDIFVGEVESIFLNLSTGHIIPIKVL